MESFMNTMIVRSFIVSWILWQAYAWSTVGRSSRVECNALSSSQSISSRDASNTMVRIVGIPGTGTQMLPISYVQGFTRWILMPLLDTQEATSSVPFLTRYESDPEGSSRWMQQVGQQLLVRSKSSDKGDAEVLIRPTLDFLIKAGVPAYVMAGMQVTLSDSPFDQLGTASSWNSTIPLLAQQWISFSMVMEPRMRLAIFAGSAADGTDPRLVAIGHAQIQHALELLGIVLSTTTSAHDLSQGFHIISVPLTQDFISLPASTCEMAGNNQRLDQGIYTESTNEALGDSHRLYVTCIATAEPDMRELFTLDQDLIEMTSSSWLQIQVVRRRQ